MKSPHFLLLLTLACGMAVAAITGVKQQSLRKEFQRLDREYGFLAVEAPDRTYVRRIPGEDALHFRFRMHLVPGQTYLWKHGWGQGSSGGFQDPKELHAQARIRFDEGKDCLMAFYTYDSGSAAMSLHHGDAGRFIIDHKDELEVTTFDLQETHSYELDELVTLVQIRFPDALFAEFSQRFPRVAKVRGRSILEFTFGPQQAFVSADQEQVTK